MTCSCFGGGAKDYDCIGLPNLGNSCFLNVALQALRATPGVFNATAAHTQCVEECSIRNTPCVVSMCNKAFRKKPEELYNNLEGILDGYVAGQFVDGTEMFQVLLEHLEKVFDGDSYPFRHRICQFGTCECGQVVDLDVTSSVIDLGIKVDGVLMMSLDQCRAAKLSSDCTRCGAKFGIDIHTQVAPSSNVAFHFERSENTNGSERKLEHFVEFPEVFMTSDDLKYDLYFVMQHHGPLRAGHFTCYVLIRSGWVKVSDSVVRPSNLLEALQCCASLVLYRKAKEGVKDQPPNTSDNHGIVIDQPTNSNDGHEDHQHSNKSDNHVTDQRNKPSRLEAIDDVLYEMLIRRLEGGMLCGDSKNLAFQRARNKVYELTRKNSYAVRMVDTYLGGGATKVVINTETRRVVPRRGEMRAIVDYYYMQSCGSGAAKLAPAIRDSFHGISKGFIQNWLNSRGYQMAKTPAFTNLEPLKPVRATRILHIQQIDLTNMPKLEKDGRTYSYVMSILDVFSRYLWLVPMYNKTAELVKEGLDRVHKQYGLCEIAQTDQGGEFKGVLNSYYQEKGIEVRRSSAYSPTSQGKDERSHGTWKSIMCFKKFEKLDQGDWIDELQDSLNRYNQRVHRSFGDKLSPHNVFFGMRNKNVIVPDSSDENDEEPQEIQVERRQQEAEKIRAEALALSDRAAALMVETHRSKNPVATYEIGDHVLIKLKKSKGKIKGKKTFDRKVYHGQVLETKKGKYLIGFSKDEKMAKEWLPVSALTAPTNRLQTALQEKAAGKNNHHGKPLKICQCDDKTCLLNSSRACQFKMNLRCCQKVNNNCVLKGHNFLYKSRPVHVVADPPNQESLEEDASTAANDLNEDDASCPDQVLLGRTALMEEESSQLDMADVPSSIDPSIELSEEAIDPETMEALRFSAQGEEETRQTLVVPLSGEEKGLMGLNHKSRLFARYLGSHGTVFRKVPGHYVFSTALYDQFDTFVDQMSQAEHFMRFKDHFLTAWLSSFRRNVRFETDGDFVKLDKTSARHYDQWKDSLLSIS